MKYILPALLLFPLHDLEAQDQIDVVPWTCADGYEAYYVSIAPDTVLVPYMASWTSGPPVRTLLICITGDCTNAGLITNQTHDTLEIGWSGMWGWYLEDFWLNLQIFDGVNYSVSDAYFTTTENAPDTLSIDVPTVVQTAAGDSLAWVVQASNWGHRYLLPGVCHAHSHNVDRQHDRSRAVHGCRRSDRFARRVPPCLWVQFRIQRATENLAAGLPDDERGYQRRARLFLQG
ncbi:MAG: hypothetical protein IPI07_17095 [Flavobacteriales bacterium]|nr:hypothetical protein [Flavobacteriales bacterium]